MCVTYPSGKNIWYRYDEDRVNDRVSRLGSIVYDDWDNLGDIPVNENYSYLGVGTVIGVNRPYAGDLQMIGLDRFGRREEITWFNNNTLENNVHLTYGYDEDGNILWKVDNVLANKDELYTYDGLNRLTSFTRGTLNTAHTSISSEKRSQIWSLDALGNWTSFSTSVNGGTPVTETRTHNAGNQLTEIDDGTTTTNFAYDPNGNLRGEHDVDDQFYDAWNRLKSSGSAVYEYDALGRRITTDPDGSSTTTATTDLYYSAQWQVLEEKRGTWVAQNVFSPFYVDDIIYHHSPSEILSAEQDVNHNVVAVVLTCPHSLYQML